MADLADVAASKRLAGRAKDQAALSRIDEALARRGEVNAHRRRHHDGHLARIRRTGGDSHHHGAPISLRRFRASGSMKEHPAQLVPPGFGSDLEEPRFPSAPVSAAGAPTRCSVRVAQHDTRVL